MRIPHTHTRRQGQTNNIERIYSQNNRHSIRVEGVAQPLKTKPTKGRKELFCQATKQPTTNQQAERGKIEEKEIIIRITEWHGLSLCSTVLSHTLGSLLHWPTRSRLACVCVCAHDGSVLALFSKLLLTCPHFKCEWVIGAFIWTNVAAVLRAGPCHYSGISRLHPFAHRLVPSIHPCIHCTRPYGGCCQFGCHSLALIFVWSTSPFFSPFVCLFVRNLFASFPWIPIQWASSQASPFKLASNQSETSNSSTLAYLVLSPTSCVCMNIAGPNNQNFMFSRSVLDLYSSTTASVRLHSLRLAMPSIHCLGRGPGFIWF